MNDTATPFGVLGRMCFQKIPILSLNVTFNTAALQKQLFLGLCACNLKQRLITILFDHRKEHASTPWINPAFTSVGGWTLVLSYSFTNYSLFRDRSNAITPRTNWPVWFYKYVHVPVSSTPSLNETYYKAVNFSLWKKLGRQILIKSNINNWLVSDPGNGSVVNWQDGDINCMIIKYVTNTCKETSAPSFFGSGLGFGPIFFIHSCYYNSNNLTEYDWPVSDPCGKGELDQLNGVAEPRGNIFIHMLMNINCSPMCNFSCQW